MDKVLYLVYIATNSAMYFFIKYLSKNIFNNVSPIEIMAYMNIISFMAILPFFYNRIKLLLNSFKKHSSLAISIPSSLVKLYCISTIPVKNVIIATFSIPLMTVIMSFIFLGEFSKNEIVKYVSVVMGFIGVVIFIDVNSIAINSSIYFLLLIHIIIHASTNIIFKKISSNHYVTLFYSTFFYCIFSIIVFMFYKKFSLNILISWQVISLAIVSVLCQLCWILSIKITHRISLLQNLEFFKIIFAALFGLLFFDEPITKHNIAGGVIIILSILISNRRDIKLIFKSKRRI